MASLARVGSWRMALAISASWRRLVTAKRFEGMRKEKMQASSDGRKQEAMRPMGLTGLPMPLTRVSVGLAGLALEAVGAGALLALLGSHGGEDRLHGLFPGGVEGFGVAGGFPVAVGEADGVADGVEFVFALAYALLEVGFVFEAPLEGWGVEVGHEGVGVGVDEEAADLAADDAFEEAAEGLVVGGHGEIGPDLGGGVAEPHGGDVAGEDGGVGVAFEGAGLDGGVEGVGEAVGEEGGEGGVWDEGGSFGDVGVYGGAAELCGPGGRGVRLRWGRIGRLGGLSMEAAASEPRVAEVPRRRLASG